MNILRKNWKLSRRTLLRGMGATLALPFLDAMEAVGAEAAAKKAPVRMACLYFPNGVWRPDWFPQTPGAAWESTPSLSPLERHRSQLTVFSGLDKKHSHGGDGHYAKTANFLTGLLVKKTTGKDIGVGSLSLDQHCAERIGKLTPIPSMELGIDPVISGIDSIVGYTRLYGSYISWRSPTQPVAREINPQAAYGRLYGVMKQANAAAGAANTQTDDRKALLDLVLEDSKQLRSRLGRDDQFKLDEYMDAVRDVEKRITFFSQPESKNWKPSNGFRLEDIAAPKGAPGDHQEHVRLMLDLMVLAFRSDMTRVTTFMFANDVSGKNFSQLIPGVNGGHHEFSHHENKEEKAQSYAKINRWHTEQLAYFMDGLAAVKEGDKTLLDNSMLLFGSSISDGNSHQPDNLPILLAGKGGGRIAGGQHIASAKGTPLCNLYLSLAENMGCPLQSFGDSTGPLALG